MKRVRFESPQKFISKRMDESECHSPRPFLESRAPTQAPEIFEHERVVYSSDPIHRFEYSDCSPYPLAKKTELSALPAVTDSVYNCLPSNDLNLSMLDVHEPRSKLRNPSFNLPEESCEKINKRHQQQPILSSIENTITPPNVLVKDDNFFIKRDTLKKCGFSMNPLQQQLNGLNLYQENNPYHRKAELARTISQSVDKENVQNNLCTQQLAAVSTKSSDCNCHHCNRDEKIPAYIAHENFPLESRQTKPPCPSITTMRPSRLEYTCQPQIITCFHCEQHVQRVQTLCNCNTNSPTPQNAIDKKTWAIQKLEEKKKVDCMDLEKQTNIMKEKREPTISDLLKIIKLQNEQLQLLQEKVDKFITASTNQPQIQAGPVPVPVQNYVLQTVDSEHKISIGVMTSFEMVRTSTVINKEIVHANENAQIQCNRSQISIKEVVSKQPTNLNVLDGITPLSKNSSPELKDKENISELNNDDEVKNNACQKTINDEKTLNELSLYNVQVDNATTPLMSPEQSLYLDVRDYSDSESTSSDDNSNVGWTYYNKVMTHVNGMLQDSDMPSSASALCRNTRQQLFQMQIDKTNVSVTKRVKFGDDPLGVRQRHIYAAATDTSLKMNQLAAKYLKTVPTQHCGAKPVNTPVDISFATRKYMERHKLLQGLPSSTSPPPEVMPRFLDITALKKQPKFL